MFSTVKSYNLFSLVTINFTELLHKGLQKTNSAEVGCKIDGNRIKQDLKHVNKIMQ